MATYAENSEKVFEKWGFKNTHKFSRRIGINLYGAPGTGKTMAAHAIAKNLGRKILIVNYADIESKFVGETPKNIRKVFEVAQKSNSILFFDEADAISKMITWLIAAGVGAVVASAVMDSDKKELQTSRSREQVFKCDCCGLCCRK